MKLTLIVGIGIIALLFCMGINRLFFLACIGLICALRACWENWVMMNTPENPCNINRELPNNVEGET